MMELAESLFSENDDNSSILSLLINTLRNIHNSKIPTLDILIFEFELLKHQGFGISIFGKCGKGQIVLGSGWSLLSNSLHRGLFLNLLLQRQFIY